MSLRIDSKNRRIMHCVISSIAICIVFWSAHCRDPVLQCVCVPRVGLRTRRKDPSSQSPNAPGAEMTECPAQRWKSNMKPEGLQCRREAKSERRRKSEGEAGHRNANLGNGDSRNCVE